MYVFTLCSFPISNYTFKIYLEKCNLFLFSFEIRKHVDLVNQSNPAHPLVFFYFFAVSKILFYFYTGYLNIYCYCFDSSGLLKIIIF